MDFQSYVRAVPFHPATGRPGWDLSPLLADAGAFAAAVEAMAEPAGLLRPTHVLAMEAGGFIFASALAQRLGLGIIAARRPGKLAPPTLEEPAGPGETLEIHARDFSPEDRVLIVDDLLATGNSAAAARALIQRTGAQAIGLTLFGEYTIFEGRDKLAGMPVFSLLRL